MPEVQETSEHDDQSRPSPRGPLSGLRVIDWTVWQQGPVASAMLGDLGAEIIKLEERLHGDGGRSLYAVAGAPTNSYFETNNRNKKSVTVDLKHPQGIAMVHELVAHADVFVHNFRAGVPERLGLGYDDLRAVNPRLIYGEATAFGSKGPEGSSRGHDLLGMARSGIMMATALPGSGEPRYPAGGMGDQMGATMLAFGILAALVARERFGVGQKVEASLLGGMMWLQGFALAQQLAQGATGGPRDRTAQANPLYNWYRCSDGKWLALATPQSDRHWPELLEVLERTDLLEDPRFADHMSRERHAAACVRVLDEIFATRTRDDWLKRLASSGTVPHGPVNSLADVVGDEQALANGYVTTFDHPVRGPVGVVGFPVSLSETPAMVRTRAPELGEHTEQVLIELLGKDWDDLVRLRDAEVI